MAGLSLTLSCKRSWGMSIGQRAKSRRGAFKMTHLAVSWAMPMLWN